MRWATRSRLAALAVLVLIVAFAAGAPAWVRGQLEGAVARYGASAAVRWIVPRAAGLELRDVELTWADVPGLQVRLDRVVVAWRSPRGVTIEGGRARYEGDAESLQAGIERVRSLRAAVPEPREEAGASRPVSVRGLGVEWVAPWGTLTGKDGSVVRESERVTVAIADAQVTHPLGSVAGSDARCELTRMDGRWRVRRLSTAAVRVELSKEAGELGTLLRSRTREQVAPTSGTEAADALERLAQSLAIRARQARDAADRVRAELDQRLDPQGEVDLGGIVFAAPHAAEPWRLGPARFVVAPRDGHWKFELLAGEAEALRLGATEGAGLALTAALANRDEPLEFEVRGGPIRLGQLGIEDGAFHLRDPDRASLHANARVRLAPKESSLRVQGDVHVRALSFELSALAPAPVRGLDAAFRGSAELALDGTSLRVRGGEFEVGKVRLNGELEVARDPTASTDPTSGRPPPTTPAGMRAAAGASESPSRSKRASRYVIDAKYDVPLVPCQSIIDAAPEGLLPTVAGIKLAGSFALRGHAKIDTADLERHYDVRWDASNSCRITSVPPAIDVARFRAPFTRKVYSASGARDLVLETGPGSPGWVPYGALPRAMETAIVSFEDGRFQQHDGFDAEAIRNSIRENLRQGRFVRGASTISMQLAKNLYLSRDKHLSRKLEEALLTMYLEQALTKEQIIELYANLVEFGPAIYGVGAGAAHWFHANATELSVSQAFFLGSILPNPRADHFTASGALSPGWLRLLRTVMGYANKRGRLSDDDLVTGRAEVPVRGSPQPIREESSDPSSAGDAVDEATPTTE
jgi:hypothetical protein